MVTFAPSCILGAARASVQPLMTSQVSITAATTQTAAECPLLAAAGHCQESAAAPRASSMQSRVAPPGGERRNKLRVCQLSVVTITSVGGASAAAYIPDGGKILISPAWSWSWSWWTFCPTSSSHSASTTRSWSQDL